MAVAAQATPASADGGVVTNGASSADALLKRLEWSVIRRLDGLLQGDYRTVWRGVGMDLADLREYQYHDDVRHIDWNVTARLQVPHVRQFTEDRDLAAWFLVDLSASVDFGSVEEAGKSRRRSKRDVACEFVAVLSRLLTRHGNRVGAMLYGTEVDTVVPARSGRLHVLQLLQRMVRRPLVSPKGATHLGDLLKAGETFFKRRSTVFIVSDFYSDPGWEVPLSRLTARHDVVAMRLFDPLESELPDVGLLTLTDAETGEQLTVDTEDTSFRRRYAAAAARREASLQAMLAKAGVDTLEISTDDDLFESVLRFIDMRRQRERRTAGSAGTAPALALGHLAVASPPHLQPTGSRAST